MFWLYPDFQFFETGSDLSVSKVGNAIPVHLCFVSHFQSLVVNRALYLIAALKQTLIQFIQFDI